MPRYFTTLLALALLTLIGCTKDTPKQDPIGPSDAFAKVVFTTTPSKDRVKIGETWEYHFDWKTSPPGYESTARIGYWKKDGFEAVEFDSDKKTIRISPIPGSKMGEQEVAFITGTTAWYSVVQPIILIIDPPSGSAIKEASQMADETASARNEGY